MAAVEPVAPPVAELSEQSEHAASPVTALKLSAKQAVGVLPFAPVNPAGATQTFIPEKLTNGGAQATQVVSAGFGMLFGIQSPHTAPAVAYWPAVQAAQDAAPLAELWPALQLAHIAPAAAYWPAVQAAQGAPAVAEL